MYLRKRNTQNTKGTVMDLPKHEASLHITHNLHKDYYQTVEEYLAQGSKYEEELYDEDEWLSPEDRQKCIDTNDLWELQWYPRTPVGFCLLYGSDIDELLKKSKED